MTGSLEGRPRRPGWCQGDISTIASTNGLLRPEKQVDHDSASCLDHAGTNHRGVALRTVIGAIDGSGNEGFRLRFGHGYARRDVSAAVC